MEVTLETIYQQQLELSRQQLELKTELRVEVGRLDSKIDSLGSKVGGLNSKVGDLDGKVTDLGKRFEFLERKVDESRIRTTQWVVGIFIGTVVMIPSLGGVYISAMMLAR